MTVIAASPIPGPSGLSGPEPSGIIRSHIVHQDRAP